MKLGKEFFRRLGLGPTMFCTPLLLGQGPTYVFSGKKKTKELAMSKDIGTINNAF